MPIVKGGKPAAMLRYVDAAGIEHQVVQVRLGERIVWDGTMPALLTMPRAVGSGVARPTLVSAGQVQEMPLSDRSAGEARPPAVSAAAFPTAPPATGAGSEVLIPSLVAGADVEMATALGEGVVYVATAGEATPGSFYLPHAAGTGQAYPAVGAVPLERAVPHAAGVGEARPAVAYGEATPELAVALGAGVAISAAVQHGQVYAVPRAVGSGSVSPAGPYASASAAMPRAAGTGQAYPAMFRSFTPMGMYCTVTKRYDSANNTWFQITNMAARTDYPGTALSGNGLALSAGPTVLTAQCVWAGISNTAAIYVNGVLVAESSGSGSTQALSHTFTAVAGDVATLWTKSSGGVTNRAVQAGATSTYLTATQA